MQEVDYFAASHGISMVFRFNGDPVDVEKPDEVLRYINKPIVWVPQGCNITQYVLERVNRAQLNNAQQPMRQGVPFAALDAAGRLAAGQGCPARVCPSSWMIGCSGCSPEETSIRSLDPAAPAASATGAGAT